MPTLLAGLPIAIPPIEGGGDGNASHLLPVRVASTANVDIATLNNGDTQDGVALVTDNRFFAKNQTDLTENGIYVIGANEGETVRADDYDEDSEVIAGQIIPVTEGTLNADTGWMLATNDPITIGVTSLSYINVFAGLSGMVSGNGTTNTLTKWTDGPGSVLGDSLITDNGTTVIVNTGALSVPRLGTNNESFGAGAGVLLEAGAVQNTSAGSGAGATLTTGDDNTFLGFGADVGIATLSDTVAIGSGAVVSEAGGIAVGKGSSIAATATAAIAVGQEAVGDLSNTAVFGSTNFGINTFIIGNGSSQTAAGGVEDGTYTTTDAAAGETDLKGGDMALRPGSGTGTGLSGTLFFNFAPSKTTGSTQNPSISVLAMGGGTAPTDMPTSPVRAAGTTANALFRGGSAFPTSGNAGADIIWRMGAGDGAGREGIFEVQDSAGTTIAEFNTATEALKVTGKLTVTGVIDPTGLVLDEQADHPVAPADAKGIIWVLDSDPNILKFTDDAGTDFTLNAGGVFTNNPAGTDNEVFGAGAGAALEAGAINNTIFGNSAGAAITTGDDNVFIGKDAGIVVTTESGLVAIGARAGATLTSGSRNTLVGTDSGNLLDTQGDNTYIGFEAGLVSVSSNGTLIGVRAGLALLGGAGNTLIGFEAGVGVTTSSGNVGIGRDVLATLVTGRDNVVIGLDADVTTSAIISATILGPRATGSGSSVSIGNNAACTSTNNVSVGANSDATNNDATAVGHSAQSISARGIAIGHASNTGTGADCIMIGDTAGIATGSGIENVAVGNNALNSRTTASSCTAVGHNAGTALLIGTGTFFGNDAGLLCTGNINCLIGHRAGDTIITGNQNTILGESADVSAEGDEKTVIIGASATSITQGIAIGRLASCDSSSGTCIGNTAETGTGNACITIGRSAGASAGTGDQNICMGNDSLDAITTGSRNVAVGHNTGTAATVAADSVFIGDLAGSAVIGGLDNTFVGSSAGISVTSGSRNVVVGNAADSGAALDDTIVIGDAAVSTASNQFVVGSATSLVSEIFFGEGTDAATAATAGQDITFTQQDGGAATTVGLVGASVTWNIGNGSAGAGVNDNGGAGGGYTFNLGDGGNGGATSGVGGAGGTFTITLGAGGTGDTAGAAGIFIVESSAGTNVIEAQGATIGLYAATPVVQHSSTDQTAGFTAGGGTGINDDSTFTGGTGTAAYTVGDVVRALKLLGVMAAS